MYRPLVVLLVALLAGPALAADRYVIDQEHSRIGFSVPYDFMIIGELEGQFGEFSGELVFDRAAVAASTVRIDIVTSSVDTRFNARDIGLRSDEYLAADEYPVAHFESQEVLIKPGESILRGELTMRGITHPVRIEFDLLDLGDVLVIQGRSGISRDAFGVSGPDLSDEILIGDQVSLTLQLVFRLASAEG